MRHEVCRRFGFTPRRDTMHLRNSRFLFALIAFLFIHLASGAQGNPEPKQGTDVGAGTPPAASTPQQQSQQAPSSAPQPRGKQRRRTVRRRLRPVPRQLRRIRASSRRRRRSPLQHKIRPRPQSHSRVRPPPMTAAFSSSKKKSKKLSCTQRLWTRRCASSPHWIGERSVFSRMTNPNPLHPFGTKMFRSRWGL